MENDIYESPQVEVLCVEVESGFAHSSAGNGENWNENTGSGGSF